MIDDDYVIRTGIGLEVREGVFGTLSAEQFIAWLGEDILQGKRNGGLVIDAQNSKRRGHLVER